ncbi:microcephalin isoform X2 [Ixodes scapularis]
MPRPKEKARKTRKLKQTDRSSNKNDLAGYGSSEILCGHSKPVSISGLSTSGADCSWTRSNVVGSSKGGRAEKENQHCENIAEDTSFISETRASRSELDLSKQVLEITPKKVLIYSNGHGIESPAKRQHLHMPSPPSLSPPRVCSPSSAVASPEVPLSPMSPGDFSFSGQSTCDDGGVGEQVSAIVDKLSRGKVFNEPTVDQNKYSDEPANPNGPLKGMKVYVEVRSGTEDISHFVAPLLEKLGATVRRTISPTVTLVVFSKGRVSTRNKALQWNIPLVNMLWVEECLAHCKLAPPEKFPANIPDAYACPILSKKIRKPKSWLTKKPVYSIRRAKKGSPACQQQDSPVTPPAMSPGSLSTPLVQTSPRNASHQLLTTPSKFTVSSTKVWQAKTSSLRSPLSERSMRTNLLKFRAESARKLANLKATSVDVCPLSVNEDGNESGSKDDGPAAVDANQGRKRRLFVPVNKGPSTSPEPLIVAKKPENYPDDDSDEELSPLSVRIGALSFWSANKVTEGPCCVGGEDLRCKKRLEMATDKEIGPSSASASPDESDSGCDARKSRTSLEDFTKPKKQKRKRVSTTWIEDCHYFLSKSSDKRPSIVMTNVQLGDREAICGIVSKLGRFQVEDDVTERTTHLICGEKLRTLNLLFAMAKGCWILPTKWVYRSLESGYWLDEDPFELSDMFPAVRLSRLDRQKAKKKRNKKGLLTGMGSFYVSHKSSPPHSKMCALIKILGGELTSYQHCDVALGPIEPSKRLPGITHVSEKWLLDSVSDYSDQLYTRYSSD